MGTVQIVGAYLKRKRRTKQSFFVQQDADYQLYAPTVVDEFLIGKRASPELRQAALARLNEMGLEPFASRHPASLSGGQKQRLLLALAAESGRDLLVFDEPHKRPGRVQYAPDGKAAPAACRSGEMPAADYPRHGPDCSGR